MRTETARDLTAGTHIPDVRNLPVTGEPSRDADAATAAIRARVIKKTGRPIPVAAFQSAL